MSVETTMSPLPLQENLTTSGPNESVHSLPPEQRSFQELMVATPEFQAHLWIGKYCYPLLLLLGGFGNVATIFVLRRMNWGQSTQHIFLTSLAANDLVVLFAGPLRIWIWNMSGTEIGRLHAVLCKVLTWMSYSTSSSSSWLLTTVTAQRAMSVIWPHQINILCSTMKSRIIVALIWAASYSLYSKHLFHMEVNAAGECEVIAGLEQFDKIWQWIDLVVTSFLPSAILLVCNITLAMALYQSVSKASTLQSVRDAGTADSRKKVANSMTIMLMLISMAFVLLSLPLCVFLLWDRYVFRGLMGDPVMFAKAYLAFTVTHFLWHTNSAINFLLYCVSGSKFRRAFVTWLTCGRIINTTTVSQRGSSNTQSSVLNTVS